MPHPSTTEVYLTLAFTYLLLALTPGPNWAVIIRNSLSDRKRGVATAFGIMPAAIILATLGMAAGQAVLDTVPRAQMMLSLLCGGYLLYLGVRGIRAAMQERVKLDFASSEKTMSLRQAFAAGFFSNITNPKSIAFFASMFTVTKAYSLGLAEKVILVLGLPLVPLCTNSALALLVSHKVVRERLGDFGYYAKWATGLVMAAFGLFMMVAGW